MMYFAFIFSNLAQNTNVVKTSFAKSRADINLSIQVAFNTVLKTFLLAYQCFSAAPAMWALQYIATTWKSGDKTD